jgi:hypothetical protein
MPLRAGLFFLLFCFLMGAGTLAAQSLPGWNLRKDREGIRVYSRQTESSRFAEIRVQCELPGTLSTVVALLQDVPNQTAWAFNVRRARRIAQPRETELTYHSTIHAPWPVDSRDAVIRMQFSYDSTQRQLVVSGTNDPGRVPPQQGIVRVKESTSLWKITPVGPDRLRVDYTLRVDPGGTLPPWLINATLTTGPFQTFSRLREALRNPQYQNRHFAFLGGGLREN